MLPLDDDFTLTRDPSRRRRAAALGAVAVIGAAVAVTVVLVNHVQQPARQLAGVVASPAPPAITPTPVPTQPLTGSRYTAVDDPENRQVVVFGGIDSYDTTWLWDGKRWSLDRPPVSPPGRFAAASAYDPVTHTVLLYGGRRGSGEILDDTWAWNGVTWTELAGTGPGIDPGSVMAWDPGSGTMILVGLGQGLVDHTFRWTGDSWLPQPAGDLPQNITLIALAVDPAGGLLGVSCCPEQQQITTTWSWRNDAWHELTTRTQPQFTVALAVDPTSHGVLLFGAPFLDAGSVLWSWTGSDWAPLSNARLPAFPEAVVSDVGSQHLLLIGSIVEAVQGNPQPVHVWSLTGATWQQLG